MDGCDECAGRDGDEKFTRFHDNVCRYGWMVQYVMAKTAWAYSVGLAGGFDHPEFVVVGLGPESSAYLVNSVGEMVRRGQVLDPDDDEPVPISPGLAVRLLPVHHDHWDDGLFAMWRWYERELGGPLPPARAIQLVWPDETGRFSGDPDADPLLELRQPLLDRSPYEGGWSNTLVETADPA
ncbi:MAG TPA: DUF4262 domain-containing protein [Acidimicrobiia bacterium]|nr:DUF4262 domain-containing protein [Acidimicrobiia bacterium]